MISLKKQLNVSTLLLLAVLISIGAYHAGANRIAPTQPATIAIVRLPDVLEGLAQRGEAEVQLRALGQKINAERETREKEINRLRTEHEQLRRQARDNPDLTASADEVEEKLVLESLRYQTWMEFSADQVDLERALVLQDLYRMIKRTADRMARDSGYDMVIVDDAQGELSINPESRASRTAQIEQQIMSRLMLYSNPTIDITSDLIERMNNEFRTGQAAR
jgi:Skp family chaperone for outer membrane proteins